MWNTFGHDDNLFDLMGKPLATGNHLRNDETCWHEQTGGNVLARGLLLPYKKEEEVSMKESLIIRKYACGTHLDMTIFF